MSDWSSASSTTVKTRHNSRKTLESCTDSDASNSSSFITTTLSFLREQDDKEYSNREDEPGRQPSHSASVAEKQRVYSNKVGTLQDTSNQDCMSGDVALEVSSSFCQSISSEKEGQQQPPKRRGNAPQFTGTTRHQDLGTKKFDFGDLDFSIEETDDIVEGGEVNQSFVNTDQTESLQRITDQGSSNNVPGDRDPASESKANTCHHSEAGGGTFINVKSPRSVTSSRKEVYSDTKSSGTSTPSKSSSPRKFWFIPCTGICSRQVVAPFPDEENLSDLDETQTAGSEDQLDMAASSPEDMVPSQLKTHVKGVVWDFDKTVLKIHAYAKRISPAMVENRDLHEDFADLEGFRRVVYKLVNNEIPVGIASFGRKDVIQAYMDRAFPDRIFGENTISTPSTLNIEGLQDGQSVNGGKLLQLEQFIKKWGISRDQLVFFDDDYNNLSNLDKEGYKWCFHTPRGFTAEKWKESVEVILGKRQLDLAEPEREDLEVTRQKCSETFIAENENPSVGGIIQLQAPPTKTNKGDATGSPTRETVMSTTERSTNH